MKKPADRDHVEGMVNKGLGMACETSKEGGEEIENICPVYLLRSRMHDHNPLIVPLAFPESFFFMTLFFPCYLIYLCVSFPPFSYYLPTVCPVILQHVVVGPQANA